MTPSFTPKAVEAKTLRLDLTPSQMGILLGLRLRAEADATPKMKADMDELFSQVKPLEAASSESALLQLAKDVRTYMVLNGWASTKKALRELREAKERLDNFVAAQAALNAKEEHQR